MGLELKHGDIRQVRDFGSGKGTWVRAYIPMVRRFKSRLQPTGAGGLRKGASKRTCISCLRRAADRTSYPPLAAGQRRRRFGGGGEGLQSASFFDHFRLFGGAEIFGFAVLRFGNEIAYKPPPAGRTYRFAAGLLKKERAGKPACRT